MVTAMLFAGGIGARMKYSDMPKQFLEVGGKPIIIHTMEHFARHPKVDAIVVACKADWIGYLNELIEAFNVPKVKAVCSKPFYPNSSYSVKYEIPCKNPFTEFSAFS